MERGFHLKIYCKGSISLGQRSIVICIHWLTVAIQQRNEIPGMPAGISLQQQSKYLFHFAIVYGRKFWANDGMVVMPSVIAFLLYVFFVAVWLGLTDINDVLLGSTEQWLRSFLFLPHAVRVLSAVYLGWTAVPGLFLAHLLAWYMIFGDVSLLQLLPILVSACGCNIAVLILQSSYIGPKKVLQNHKCFC